MEAQVKLSTFHTASIVCLIIMIVAVVGALVIFFVCDIYTNFLLRTGRADKVLDRRKKEKARATSNLKQKIDMDYETEVLGAGDDGTEPLTSRNPRTGGLRSAGLSGTLKLRRGAKETGAGETAVLQQVPHQAAPVATDPAGASFKTVPLSATSVSDGTAMLASQGIAMGTMKEPVLKVPRGFTFEITEYTAVVHTEEALP